MVVHVNWKTSAGGAFQQRAALCFTQPSSCCIVRVRAPQGAMCGPEAGWHHGPLAGRGGVEAEALRGRQWCDRTARPTAAICVSHANPGGAYATVRWGGAVS